MQVFWSEVLAEFSQRVISTQASDIKKQKRKKQPQVYSSPYLLCHSQVWESPDEALDIVQQEQAVNISDVSSLKPWWEKPLP